MAHRIDRYEIVRKIATGGMADVFLALQWGDGGFVREVVVKRLHPHLTSNQNLLEDFRNEADLLARLGGRGIPHLYEFRCSTKGEWYLAMEHLRGPTVSELVHQAVGAKRLPLDVALSVGVALCRILDDVHNCTDPVSGSELGVVHGDLTPSNIVADARGHVHLLDFGLAGSDVHRSSRMGGSHGIRGTVGYFAPEAAQSEELPDRRADVFSIGALLYELVTGQEAFTRVAIEYINVVRSQPDARPCEVDGSLAPSIDELIMRCLEPEPGDRPATAGEVADAIEAAAADENLFIGQATLAEFVDTYFPVQEDAPTRIGTRVRPFVVPLPTSEVSDGTLLSADERDELLADLALFAPDGAGMLTPVPEVPAPPPPPPPPPPSPGLLSEDSQEPRFDSQPPTLPPPPDLNGDRLDASVAAAAERRARQEKETPEAFPAVSDLAWSQTEPFKPKSDEAVSAPAATKSGPTRSSESRRRASVHPDSDRVLLPKSLGDESSGGFYIYVADDD